MPYIKTILGALLVIAASYGVGYRFGENEKKELELLVSLKRMLLMLADEIKYSGTPLAECFCMLGNYENEYWSSYFKQVSKAMTAKEYRKLGKILEESLHHFPMKKYLKAEDINDFIRFAKELGCFDRESKLGRIEQYVRQIEHRITYLEKSINERVRLYRILGIACGIFITILIV